MLTPDLVSVWKQPFAHVAVVMLILNVAELVGCILTYLKMWIWGHLCYLTVCNESRIDAALFYIHFHNRNGTSNFKTCFVSPSREEPSIMPLFKSGRTIFRILCIVLSSHLNKELKKGEGGN